MNSVPLTGKGKKKREWDRARTSVRKQWRREKKRGECRSEKTKEGGRKKGE